MTDAMLDYGWNKQGAAGRKACRKALEQASPVDDVVVRRPRITGATATVRVVYTLDDTRRIDRLSFVEQNGRWLIDGVKLQGSAS